MSEGKQEARDNEAEQWLSMLHQMDAAGFVGCYAERAALRKHLEERVATRQANQSQETHIQHEWGCPAWSSGDNSECDDICGATSRAKGNGEGKPSASTSSPSQPQEKAQPESGEMGVCDLVSTPHPQECCGEAWRPLPNANDMLRHIVGSLRGYPNAGGDKGVMTEVERIEQAAFQRGQQAMTEKAAQLGHRVAFEHLDMHRSQRTYTWHEVEDALTASSKVVRSLASAEPPQPVAWEIKTGGLPNTVTPSGEPPQEPK